jgi:uncharacterized protein YfaS (alpha-2-macroglobulin family)
MIFFCQFAGATLVEKIAVPKSNHSTKKIIVGTQPVVASEAAEKLQYQGNYLEAFNIYTKLLLDKKYLDKKSDNAKLFKSAVFCLKRLRLEKDFDAFATKTLNLHASDWRLLAAVADSYIRIGHYGFIIGGKFIRGSHRGGGLIANSTERDRCRSLQLYLMAMKLLQHKITVAGKTEKRQFFKQFADAISYNRLGQQAWQLQYLTDLTKLPDYQKGYSWYRYGGGRRQGAPVTATGKPVFYTYPKNFCATGENKKIASTDELSAMMTRLNQARNDGERWRWALNESKYFGNQAAESRWAEFLLRQFGVQTMAYRIKPDELKDGPFAVHSLSENETIAKLATGVERFKLPVSANYIEIFKQIGQQKSSWGENSLNTLAKIFANRRQYSKAAKYWQESIKRFGMGSDNWKQKKLDQIIGNWFEFQSVNKFAAGRPPLVKFRYRNAKQVDLSLYSLKRDLYLNDIKHYLTSNPMTVDWNRININQIGYMVVIKEEGRYLDQKLEQWSHKLKPAKDHFDRREQLTVPITKPGIYLLKAKVANGNVSRIIIWITDTAIVSRIAGDNKLFYVADAADGSPVAGAKIDFFGYRTKYLKGKWLGGRRFDVQTDKFSLITDKNGMVVVPNSKFTKQFCYLKTVTGKQRFATSGFSDYWYPQNYRYNYNLRKVFGISDRPVYRPGQEIKFKYWIRQVTYDKREERSYANLPVTVEIWSPRGSKIWTKSLTTNKFGGLAGKYELPADAALGNYSIRIKKMGGYLNFRVEEYKKPEFEVVVDAPKRPIVLGEKFTAIIRANYYFGAPVTKAKVKYKVMRYAHQFSWFPDAPWDWLYGSGYWWFSSDYSWYPGWINWGWRSPVPLWAAWNYTATSPPELVAENEVDIAANGTVKVVIDSALAKANFGDVDSRYEITAEVVDASRRTIVGKGQVIAAIKPFKICLWTNNGFYRVTNDIEVGIKAITPDNKGVAGKGIFTLFLLTYAKDGKPVERALRQWKLNTDSHGDGQIKFTVTNAGQYRVAYELQDGKGGFAKGGTIFSVLSDNKKVNNNFRFSALELINDKKEYTVGDELELMISSDRPDSTVILFVRAGNSKLARAELVKLNGRVALKKIKITKADMPNFFIEAWTVTAGKIHKVVKRIAVPPEKRVLNVEVIPSQERYKPGAKAKVKLKITDYHGKPVQGEVVVTIYDKSVEYISGGSNVPAIQPFFWKWLKQYHLNLGFSMHNWFGNILRRGELSLKSIGVFGQLSSPTQTDGMLDDGELKTFAARADGGLGIGTKSTSRILACEVTSNPQELELKRIGADVSQMYAKSTAPTVKVRRQFADTAYWAASLITNQKGIIEVTLDMPENLTTWKIKAWSMTAETQVGQGEAEVITTKDFLIRMQIPRFLVENDRAFISAIVHNYLPHSKVAEVKLKISGDALSCKDNKPVKVEIASRGEKRIDWLVNAEREGQVKVTMSAVSPGDSDAMEMSFPVLVHGVAKQLAYSGTLRGDKKSDRAFITITLPKARRVKSARLQINYSPTLAAAMLDALPYMVSSDYNNTEATLNRFLPAVMVQQALKRIGVKLQQIRSKRVNLNAQELGDTSKRAGQWQRWQDNPVFNEKKLQQLVAEGIKALCFMQNSDGGWGWFSGYNERSWSDTTAQVVRGLILAAANGVAVDKKSLQRGIEWLKNYQQQRVDAIRQEKASVDNGDALVVRVLAMADIADSNMIAMSNYLYQQRDKLSLYGKALTALALTKQGNKSRVMMLKRNIEQFLIEDNENQTAWLRLPADNCWWFWYGAEYETQAAYLELLNRTTPGSKIASRLVKYLLNNRKHATYWNSTRDTAYCLEAMVGYLKSSNELNPELTVEILIDGKIAKSVKITKDNLFSFDSSLMLYGKELTTGRHTIELRRQGRGPLYFNAYLNYFSLEKFIKKAGLEIKVERRYYRLERDKKATVKTAGTRGQVVELSVEKYRRIALTTGDKIASGDLIEVELIINSKNDYSYLMFEDQKIAGCEPVDLRSGYNGNALGAYIEFRDTNVRFFVRNLMRGKHSVSYRIRAEIPGTFSALPASGLGIYAPELKANSDEFNIAIDDSSTQKRVKP